MKSNVAAALRQVIAAYFHIKAERLVDHTHLRDDLGADWLDRLELLIMIEDYVSDLQVSDVAAEQVETIGDLMRVIEPHRKRPVRERPWTESSDTTLLSGFRFQN